MATDTKDPDPAELCVGEPTATTAESPNADQEARR
jgi:hypothetical protein